MTLGVPLTYSLPQGYSSRQQQGFTLLEVMVALTILAVVAVSASQASQSYLNSVDNMKSRTRAYFIAQNTLATLRIEQKVPMGVDVQKIDMAGRTWQVTITPSKSQTATSTQVSIGVAPADSNNNLVTLETLLANPVGQP